MTNIINKFIKKYIIILLSGLLVIAIFMVIGLYNNNNMLTKTNDELTSALTQSNENYKQCLENKDANQNEEAD